MRLFRTICGMCALLGMLHLSVSARSQPGDPGPQAPSGGSPSEEKTLTPAELDALVAPIALYPDPLLANVLMAATYPLEVVRAERWLNENKKLQGDALKAAAEKQNWDESVKALVATPAVLPMMSEHLDWTQQLGEAFLARPQDVMDAVQRLRGEGLRAEETHVDQRAGRDGQGRAEPAGHLHRARVGGYHLCAVLRAGCRLWRLALRGLSGISVLLGRPGLYCRGRPCDGHRVRRGICDRPLGHGRLLGRQPHQLGRRSHRHQSRRARRTLAAQSAASPGRTVQQRKSATEIWEC